MPESESARSGGLKILLGFAVAFVLGGYFSVRTPFLSTFFGGLSPIALGTRETITRLERARSEAEGRCSIVQLVLAGSRDLHRKVEGRRLYLAAKVEADALIASFSATLLCGIDEKELAALQEMGKTAEGQVRSFIV
ncbi:hypothetical protein, partial [Paludisphaera rhizosphaerae]|uniref:hypothetical protein n=1 Tax=Paludisphaera rhizosphaerae TaxID=2711216 RepID=UPI0013ED1163